MPVAVLEVGELSTVPDNTSTVQTTVDYSVQTAHRATGLSVTSRDHLAASSVTLADSGVQATSDAALADSSPREAQQNMPDTTGTEQDVVASQNASTSTVPGEAQQNMPDTVTSAGTEQDFVTSQHVEQTLQAATCSAGVNNNCYM